MKISTINAFIRALTAGSVIALLVGCDASSGVSETENPSQEPDPVVVDYPIIYIERPIPRDEDGEVIPDTITDPIAFKPGARLFVKARAAVTAEATVLTDSIFIDPEAPEGTSLPLYDVKDLSLSEDGLRVLFAMRAPEIEDADEDEQPTWNIWEYNHENGELRRIIESDLIAEQGQDVAPAYLADGRIVFSSTRQPRSKAILLDENKPQYNPGTEADRDNATFVLHTMEDDGAPINQITYNQSHDLSPMVLGNGDILFLRWNNYVGGSDAISMYTVKPDGTKVSPHYGYHSQETGTDGADAVLTNPILLPDGRLLASQRLRSSRTQGGDMVYVDIDNFVENTQLIESGSSSSTAQESATSGLVYTNDSVSPQGYYSSAYKLADGSDRLIASWSACLVEGIKLGLYINTEGQLVDNLGRFVDRDGDPLPPNQTPILPANSEIGVYACGNNISILDQLRAPPPIYGIWTIDPSDNTQRPVVLAKDDLMYTDALVLEAQPPLTYTPEDPISDEKQALIDADLGVLHIRSVYDFHGTDNTSGGISSMANPAITPAEQRPARFIRIIKAVSLPNDDVLDIDNIAFGVTSPRQMKDIVGYVPIEPDGSAKFAVPADVAFTFSILDANGRRLDNYLGRRHMNWLTVRPGETRECGGCHEQDNTLAHGRLEAETPSSWAGSSDGGRFPNSKLLDSLGTEHPAPNVGDTMAEYYANYVGVRMPSVDIVYEDEWTDAAAVPKSASYSLSYAELPYTLAASEPVEDEAEAKKAPASIACQTEWTALCRTVVNYIAHIQPIWDHNREVKDETDPAIIVRDDTCTSCHNTADADGNPQLPAQQLRLTGELSDLENNTQYITSYNELLRGDFEQELVVDEDTGAVSLVDKQRQLVVDGEPQFERNEDGSLRLDGEGNPIPVLRRFRIGSVLNTGGANSSANREFFSLFASGGSHEGRLQPAELKLISEWLDIGAQYYNNPFDVPQ